MKLKNVTLEMSLKPFRQTDDAYVRDVCRTIFRQWYEYIRHADVVSVLLWTADGSEMLEYGGNLDASFDWSRYIGGANHTRDLDKRLDPQGVGLHTRCYLYMENPPVYTYSLLKQVVKIVKEVGREITGKPIRVGNGFDPGPEFAKSDFKYKRHREICLSNTFGHNSFLCCFAELHGDLRRYAGFPDGIPEGTPFGTFFGRQCEHFLRDLGFDYVWFSNGLGFGYETWGVTGSLFDGKSFHSASAADYTEKILGFWKHFRTECPDYRIETRGTNLTVGVDLATDGAPLREIYRGGFNMLPPPNSPWAALNGDFGLEIAGYMSRIAEIPGEDYLYRFYVHDPWWMNSPWLDRYERQPYDLYMPLAVSRVDETGEVRSPTHVNLLTVDNCMGETPDKCPNEIIPHFMNAMENAPDRISPFLWVYPFDEYHDAVLRDRARLDEVFFGDWFIRGAVNHGLPLSTVVSARNFVRTSDTRPELYQGSVLVSPVPAAGGEWERSMIEHVHRGGSALFYGPLTHAGKELLRLLNLELAAPVEGIFDIRVELPGDTLLKEPAPTVVNHRALLSGGGLREVLRDADDPYTRPLSWVSGPDGMRAAAVSRSDPEWNGGRAVWVRGTNGCSYRAGEMLLVPDDPAQYYPAESLVRLSLSEFGFDLRFAKYGPGIKTPVTMLHRSGNAFWFSGYVPDTSVEMKLRFPLGAPLFVTGETVYENGYSVFHMPRSWYKECRVFAQQPQDGVLSCIEHTPVSHAMRRRIRVSGLKNTTLRIFPETGFEKTTELLLNSQPEDHLTGDPIEWTLRESPWGPYLEVHNLTGNLMISTPFADKKVF